MSNTEGLLSNIDLDAAFDTSVEDIKNDSDPAIKRLVKLADAAVNHEELVIDLERNLNEAKGFLNNIKTIEMPDLMAECGLTEFTHTSGAKLKLTNFVSGSLPKEPDKRQLAIDELTKMGKNAENLIKTNVSVLFDKEEHKKALVLAEELRKLKFDVVVDSGVHHSTLAAFARECLKKGIQINTEVLGLYAGKTVDIKLPKE